jgi:hypothetical protein
MILYKQNKVNNSTLFMGVNSYKILSFELYEDTTDSEGTPMQLWTILNISNVFGPFRMIKILRKGTIHIITIVA